MPTPQTFRIMISMNKLINVLKAAMAKRAVSPMDPGKFRDPIALQTEWLPLKQGGANFGTHRMVKVSNTRYEFCASRGGKWFWGSFTFIGVVVLTMPFLPLAKTPRHPIALMAVGTLFFLIGSIGFYFNTIPFVFDKNTGTFWKRRSRSRGNGVPDYHHQLRPDSTQFSEIHAVQLIEEFVSGNKSSYHSYELNLVLKSGKRINVVDHGDIKLLRQEIMELSAFLGVPIWDATRESGALW